MTKEHTRRRVLLAWQHGGNLGHVTRLRELTRLVADCGASAVLAVPAKHLNACLWSEYEGEVLAAPDPRPSASRDAVRSFADVLIALGYADQESLLLSVGHWLLTFDRLQVDALVVDYAPAAQLAAAIAGLPALQVTNGFDGPPAACPVFGIGVRGPLIERRNDRQKERLDKCFAAVGSRFGAAGPMFLGRVLEYPMQLLDCIAATDPYDATRTGGVYVGPLGQPVEIANASWLGMPANSFKVFVYLRTQPLLDTVLTAITGPAFGIGASVVCVCPEATSETMARWRSAGVAMWPNSIDLKQVLPACDLVISYGAAALTCRSLMAAKTQLLLPTDSEKWLIADRVARTGTALRLSPRASAAEVAIAARRLLADGSGKQAARAIASSLDSMDGRALEAVRTFLARATVQPQPGQPAGAMHATAHD